MNKLVPSSGLQLWVLLLLVLCGRGGLAETTDPAVILPGDQVCSRRTCNCHEDISTVVQEVVKTLQPMVIQAVHDQAIQLSHMNKRKIQQMTNRLSDLEEKISKKSRAVRREIHAATEMAHKDLKAAEERIAGLLKTVVTSYSKSKDRTASGQPGRRTTRTTISPGPRVQLNANASHCAEVQRGGSSESGLYIITLHKEQESIEVYCDLDTDGGGWTVIQRRDDTPPYLSFYRGWDDYKRGFGSLTGEFWLGLDRIHVLTVDSSTPVRLRVDMEDWEGNEAFAEYDLFRVGGESDKYRLYVEGYNEGKGGAGDSLAKDHSGMAFSTRDRDNDISFFSNCASRYFGAWWYEKCHSSNLNGVYLGGDIEAKPGAGVLWFTWKQSQTYSLKKVEMKIRPKDL